MSPWLKFHDSGRYGEAVRPWKVLLNVTILIRLLCKQYTLEEARSYEELLFANKAVYLSHILTRILSIRKGRNKK